jgi:ammonia channel protein AmtB
MIVWSAVPTFFFLMAFKRLSILRVGEVIELVGMDYLERD